MENVREEERKGIKRERERERLTREKFDNWRIQENLQLCVMMVIILFSRRERNVSSRHVYRFFPLFRKLGRKDRKKVELN